MELHGRPAGQVHTHDTSFREGKVHDLEPGDHNCHVFETPEQSLEVLVPFLKDGLDAGDRCISTVLETPVEDVRESLEKRGIDTEARIAAGDLVLRSADEGYGEAGSFDVEDRIAQLEGMVLKAREDGYENLRSAGEMTWAAGGGLDRETLLTYESKLNDFVGEGIGRHVIGLCQYHTSAFEPDVMADVLRAHPITVHGSRVRENLFYQPPDVFLADDPQAELDHLLERLFEEPDGSQAPEDDARELQERNERLKRFTEAVSHDLKEPLRAVKAHLERIEDQPGLRWPGRAEKSIEFAVEGAGRMEKMLEALRDYAQVETLDLETSPVDSGEILDEVRSRLATQLQECGVDLTHDEMPTVQADPDQLERVFQNLLANALQHGGPELSHVHVGVEDLGPRWRFSVEDDGKGIPSGKRDRIFDVFERGPSAGSAHGVGLGLAFCERIVERHGGRIELTSEPDEGAVFSFTLPKPDDAASTD